MRKALIATVLVLVLSAGFAWAEELPMITVGHVGHDHQIALYVAADEGESLAKNYGVHFVAQKEFEVYDLYDGGKPIARVRMVRVGGGAKMPAALEQGHIEVGLGGLGPVAKFIDKGSPMKVLMPLNNDGDFLIGGKGVEAKNWDEFVKYIKASPRPVKIGYKDPMAVAYMILTRALKEEGLTFGPETLGKDGKPVNVITFNIQELENALPSLESGIIDAVVVNEPMGSILVGKGVGRMITDLSSLPPKGKWEGHPCCVVAARTDAIETKRGIIKSLLKAIAAGADIISKDKAKALASETKWTKTDPEIGKKSIENVDYLYEPDKDWIGGVDTWLELMVSSGLFTGSLKDKSVQDARNSVLYLDITEEALKELGAAKSR